jgi:hypothetical protein
MHGAVQGVGKAGEVRAALARPEMRLRFARAERGELRGGNRNGIRLSGRESAYNAGHA